MIRHLASGFLLTLAFALGCGKDKGTNPGPPGADTTPPALVQNLAALPYDTSSIDLTWTAPSDNGPTGKAYAYEIRYSTASSAPWEQMAEASGEPNPKAAGQAESFRVGALFAGTAYYFRLRSRDERGNLSGTSNQASATTASRPAPPFRWGGDFTTDYYPRGVTSADLNRDGRLDLVSTNFRSQDGRGSGSVSVLLGNGDGTFGARNDVIIAAQPGSPVVGEMSGDGVLDVVVPVSLNPTHAASLLYGNGDGTLQAPKNWATEYGPADVAMGDFDRDGKNDLAVANAGLVPDGSDFTVGIHIAYFKPRVLYPTGRQPFGIAAGDLNADGVLDLVTAGYVFPGVVTTFYPAVSVLLGHGNGTFAAHSTFPSAPLPVAVELADLNEDGRLDILVACTSAQSISVFLGNGDGTFGTHREFPVRDRAASLCLGDFNRDGHTDVAVPLGNWISVLLGRGDGTFAPSIDFVWPHRVLSGGGITGGDFNGDGWLDLAVAHPETHGVAVLLNTGEWSSSAQSAFRN